MENTHNSGTTDIQFSMDEAKSYLDNLAIAIKSYATDLQLTQQKKDLVRAQAKSKSLMQQGNELEKKRMGIEEEIAANKNDKTNTDLAERKHNNKQKIDNNLITQANQTKELNNQKLAIALLEDGSKK